LYRKVAYMDFERVAAESVGIDSRLVRKALDFLAEHKAYPHSLLILRHGKLAVSVSYAPWSESKLHRLFSCTKSFTSILIGILEKRGLISLDDTLCSYFPEYVDDNTDPRLLKMTIENALKMETCHSYAAHKLKPGSRCVCTYSDNWTRSFFEGKCDHNPGSFFWYDDNSTHVLGSIVEKVTGMSLLDFARQEIFDEIGISRDTYWIRDDAGTCNANSGLMIGPMDLLKFAYFVSQGCAGKVRPEYLAAALTSQSDNSGSSGGSMDLASGYGYLYWMHSHNGWMMYGSAGQFAISIPDKDMIIVVNNDNQMLNKNQTILDALWPIVDNLDRPGLVEDPSFVEFSATRRLPVQKNWEKLPSLKKDVEYENSGFGLERIKLDTDKKVFEITLEKKTYSFSFGIGENVFQPLPFYPDMTDTASSLGMTDTGSIIFLSQFVGRELGSFVVELKLWDDGSVDTAVKTYGELEFKFYNGYATGKNRI